MTERLQKLLRQRTLIQEHLAWLDREIAEAEGVPSLPPAINRSTPVAANTGSAARTVTAPPATITKTDDADEILGKFQQEARATPADARRGCLIVFFVVLGVIILAVGIAYYFYARHLGRWW